MRIHTKHSEETKRKISESRIGQKNFLDRKHSEESREKMRISKLGRRLSKEWKEKIRKAMIGRISPIKGKKLPKEWRDNIVKSNIGRKLPPRTKEHTEKLRQANLGRIGPRNEQHWNWKGGINSPKVKIRQHSKYGIWRKTIYERDGYKCVLCGKKGKVVVDHILPLYAIVECLIDLYGKDCFYEKIFNHPLVWSLDNGRTLCINCHLKTETYGVQTKKQIREQKAKVLLQLG